MPKIAASPIATRNDEYNAADGGLYADTARLRTQQMTAKRWRLAVSPSDARRRQAEAKERTCGYVTELKPTRTPQMTASTPTQRG